MSVVIIGGHDRMVRQYKEICENHKYKAKVFTQMKTGLDKLIGRPDLLILFTNTVSHKMVRCVLDEVDENRTDIVRCHTSSGTALAEKKTLRVADVHAFPGHIACDSASRAEIVVPVMKDGKVYAVLDVDSPFEDRFTAEDEAFLEKIAALLAEKF